MSLRGARLFSHFRILLILQCCVVSAQTYNRKQFEADSARIMEPKLVRPQFKFDNRITLYEGQTLAINGFDAGVLLKDRLRITLGYYMMNDDLNAFRETIDSNDVGRLIKIEYGALNTEIIYKDWRYLSLGMPLEFGAGNSRLSYKNFTSDEIYKKQAGIIVLSHFGLSATFKPIRWFGLKGILGYRKMIYNQNKEFDFDGFFSSIGFNVDVREIIKDVKMYRLKKKYRRGNNISNAVDLITD